MSVRFLVCCMGLLGIFPILTSAQTGRGFVSVEGYVGFSKEVQVGKIVKLEPSDYNKPLMMPQTYGKPYRISFAVSETIRGNKAKTVEIVVALQVTWTLQYFIDHRTELMLVVSQGPLDSVPLPEVGIEEQGKRVDGSYYQFRILDPMIEKGDARQASIERQLGFSYDLGRMFDDDLSVISGREEILKRAKNFAQDHTEICKCVRLRVPNSFGRLCGNPYAYSEISLPRIAKTERLLLSLLKRPNIILDRTAEKSSDLERYGLLYDVLRALDSYPSRKNAENIRKFLKTLPPFTVGPEGRYGTPQRVHDFGISMLDRWKL